MLYANKKAFTMIELVFVIVVLGILASVAIPRFAVTRQDAQLAKAKSDVAAIRSAIISERQTRLFRGQSGFISAIDNGATNAEGQTIFDGNGTSVLLQYGIVTSASNGHWMRTDGDEYTYTVAIGTAVFDYTKATGTFDCVDSTVCSILTD